MIVGQDALSRSVEPLFLLLLKVQRGDSAHRDVAKLHQECCRALEAHEGTCRELDLPAADAADARYALVALLDEAALRDDGALREYWLPRLLQTRFFEENQAGDGFYERLAKLRAEGKRTAVLRVFYVCLLLGFRGKYDLRGSELELLEVQESVRSELQRAKAIPADVLLSPHGRRPYERIADVGRNRLVLTLAAISACIAVVSYAGMRFSLAQQTTRLIDQISSLTGS